jgi:SAM-dependent methyltransferase
LALKAKRFFDARDLVGLEQELCSSSKSAFVIKSLQRIPKSSRLLEIGCSRGYLTSYFILAGFGILGVDISDSALKAAQCNFGPFFEDAISPKIHRGAPYDAIYHIGTIGCVSDPVGLTRSLLALLKPGGKLLFNAPNMLGCWLRGQLWIDFAPPPDVVTLYMPGFWHRFFSDEADVTEVVETCSPEYSLGIWVRKVSRKWSPPKAAHLEESLQHYKNGPSFNSNGILGLRGRVESQATKILSLLNVQHFVPRLATPFGIFVTLTKK